MATVIVQQFLSADHDPFIFAHRGYSKLFPENTMLAFRQALDNGAIAIECDIQLTRDLEPVIIHDFTLKRTTGKSGKVSQVDWGTVKNLDTGSWFDKSFSSETIPHLDDLLAILPPQVLLNLELKSEKKSTQKDDLVKIVWEKVQSAGISDQVLFSSFDTDVVKKLRHKAPKAHVGLLHNSYFGNLPIGLISEVNPVSIQTSFRNSCSSFVTKAKQHHLPVFVYTVNSYHEMTSCFEQGVKGIFSDYPSMDCLIAESQN